MEKEIKKLLDTANALKKATELNINKALEQIDNIKDENTKEFLKNSLSLAKNGTLNVDGFIEQSKKYIEDASRINN
jgi:hypothetical protein